MSGERGRAAGLGREESDFCSQEKITMFILLGLNVHCKAPVNFALRCKFFAFGSTKTYSRVVKFALCRCSLVIIVLHKPLHHTMIHLQATGQHKNKAGLTHAPVYYLLASTHLNVQHTPPTCPKCAYKISRKYFCRFMNSRLRNFV